MPESVTAISAPYSSAPDMTSRALRRRDGLDDVAVEVADLDDTRLVLVVLREVQLAVLRRAARRRARRRGRPRRAPPAVGAGGTSPTIVVHSREPVTARAGLRARGGRDRAARALVARLS